MRPPQRFSSKHGVKLSSKWAHQMGAALFVVVLVSLVVSLMGAQLVNRLVFTQRGAMNEADLAIARENAEAALRDGEQDVRCRQWKVADDGTAGSYVFVENASRPQGQKRPHCDIQATDPTQNGSLGGAIGLCANGYITVRLDDPNTLPPPAEIIKCRNAFGTITKAPLVDFGTFSLATQPYYTVEVLLLPNGQVGQNIPYYRIRATGFGRNNLTKITLESIFRPL